MSLDEEHVARMILGRRTPEVIESDLVEGRRRGVARQVSAILTAGAIRLHHHRHGVPADVSLVSPLQRAIARILLLLARRDRIDVGGVGPEWQIGARTARVIDHALQQVVSPLRSVRSQDRIDRFDPFLSFRGVDVVVLGLLSHFVGVPARPRYDPGLVFLVKAISDSPPASRALPASNHSARTRTA